MMCWWAGQGGGTVQSEFQFDFHEEPRGKFGKWRARHRLFRYISAGGLGQTRRTTADDIAESRARAFAIFLVILALVWSVFYFLPCP